MVGEARKDGARETTSRTRYSFFDLSYFFFKDEGETHHIIQLVRVVMEAFNKLIDAFHDHITLFAMNCLNMNGFVSQEFGCILLFIKDTKISGVFPKKVDLK